MNSKLEPYLTDGTLIVSDSWLSALTECPRKFNYLYSLRRQLAASKPALSFGNAVHSALAVRYSKDPDLDHPDTEPEMLDAAAKYLAEHPIPDGDHRTLDHCHKILRAYNKKYPIDFDVMFHAGKPFVEHRFAVVFGDVEGVPVVYTGLIDIGVKDHTLPWIVDTKTSSVMGTGFFQDQAVSPQQWGYGWAFHKSTGIMPTGYTINGIPTNAPSKTGKIVLKNGEYDCEFQRASTFLNEDMLLEWEENTYFLIKEFLHHVETDHFPTHRKGHCVSKYGTCEFYEVCNLPMDQRGVMLQSGMFEPKVRVLADEI